MSNKQESNVSKLLPFVAILLLIVLYFLYKYSYWLRRKVSFIAPSLPFGNFFSLFSGKKHLSVISQDLYNNFKSKGEKFGGAYFMQDPLFIPVDPQLIKSILCSDFEYFNDRGVHFVPKNDPISSHLFNLPQAPWKALRTKLTPVFTSGKIKAMFEIVLKCGENLVEVTQDDVGKPVDLYNSILRYALDIIGNCAFGIDCNTLKDQNSNFKEIADQVRLPRVWNGLKMLISLMGPDIITPGNMTIIEKEVIQFFLDIVEQNVQYRQTNNIRRNDFFQLLMDMKNNDEALSKTDGLKMDLRLMAAQSFVFFAAGFETSSMAINLCLFELAQNLEIQEKLRTEIKKVKENDGKITYDGINSMTYLNCVVQETLRKYPPLGYLNRMCIKDYKIPDSDVVIEKGTKILVSVLGLHRDADYYPEPDKFDPERFSEENKKNRTPFTYMPFGEGRRMCIGERFGSIQTKVCLISLLLNYEFTLNGKTKLPIDYEAHSFILVLRSPIYFNLKRVQGI